MSSAVARMAFTALLRSPPVRFYSRPRASFVDRVTVLLKGGNGGAGCASFTKGPNREVVPPDGGHGGSGGSVYLQGSEKCASLHASLGKLRAEDGGRGRGGRQNGRRGSDLVVNVPLGTVVREVALVREEAEQMEADGEVMMVGEEDVVKVGDQQVPGAVSVAGHSKFEEDVEIAELNADGERALVARGGHGGRGNVSFKSSTNRSPELAEPGESGESRRVELELKSIADVGLVGMPNAGKSTLLRAMSAAKPRVAAYPFTTLRPHIGVVRAVERGVPLHRTLSVADIPGLIEGAHANRGLGHAFLRHIERTRVLVYVLDMGGEHAVCELAVLRKELELHEPGLSRRRKCIVANKMDVTGSGDALRKLVNSVGDAVDVFPASAKHGTGIAAVVEHLSSAVV